MAWRQWWTGHVIAEALSHSPDQALYVMDPLSYGDDGETASYDKWWRRNTISPSVRHILFPKNVGMSHWVLVIIDVVNSRVFLGDSLSNNYKDQLLPEFRSFWEQLQKHSHLSGKQELKVMEMIADYPQQHDVTSCGICVIEYAIYFISKHSASIQPGTATTFIWTATSENVSASRLRILREIMSLPSRFTSPVPETPDSEVEWVNSIKLKDPDINLKETIENGRSMPDMDVDDVDDSDVSEISDDYNLHEDGREGGGIVNSEASVPSSDIRPMEKRLTDSDNPIHETISQYWVDDTGEPYVPKCHEVVQKRAFGHAIM
ncbi:hypothetical protein BC829DRAFT_421478 [Chytridium lagenaria]|nr:hypothetical protein BC829DRAFT_421478 [Chytridium lagenaria]